MDNKLVLIDGHSILNRAFYGVPDLTNAEGLHTNAVYGFLNIMFKILEEENADHLAVAFDLSAPTFRHKMYDAYKGTRKPMPEELREQVPLMKEALNFLYYFRELMIPEIIFTVVTTLFVYRLLLRISRWLHEMEKRRDTNIV